MMKLRFVGALVGLAVSFVSVGAAIPLKLEPFNSSDVSAVASPAGVIEIHGATSLRATPETPPGEGSWVLEMECFCLGGVHDFKVTPGLPFKSKAARLLPEIGHSETWSPYTAPINPGKPWPIAWTELRLDLRLPDDGTLQIRNARLRLARPGEFEVKKAPSTNAAPAAVLEAYLNQRFSNEISSVVVGSRSITISGRFAGDRKNLFLGDVPMEYLVGGAKRYESLTPITVDSQGNYAVELPRIAKRDGRDYDRLTSRWQLFRRNAAGYEAVTHAHYADEVVCRSPQLPAVSPASKKGLGGWSPDRLPGGNELDDLGITAVTVNLFSLHQFVALTPEADATPFTWQGRTYYAREKALAKYDRTFREAEKRGVMVSAILLIDNPINATTPEAKLLGHPDAVKEGNFAMPNVTSPEGIAYYGAILNLIADRWSRNDGVHGRVHHWIVHNEVDFGWTWTNAGKKSDISYMDLYQRSMRLIQLIVRQYDPNARALISLTHHWAQPGNEFGYGSKRMLELLLRFCRAEGDFPWALAYHPYPQNLFNPRTWEDQQATFDFNSPKITPRNLEVLDAFMKLPALLYRGEVRPVQLSENGFNSRDYSRASLEDQAAGMALAWRKISKLSTIESWQYHNWIDNRHEGGLRLGLRKFPDDRDDPCGKKPVWFLYQALGTPQEDAVAAPYLKTIGILSWDEVIYRGTISEASATPDSVQPRSGANTHQ